MGVSFRGISYVRAEPLPAKYRVKRQPVSEKERAALTQQLALAPAILRGVILSAHGASYDEAGNLILPDRMEIDIKLRAKFYEQAEEKKDYITVVWETNTAYYKTGDSCRAGAGGGYGTYADFCRELYRVAGSRLPYMPPSTDSAPEYGVVNTEKCLMCLQGLESVRRHFVEDDWIPDPTVEYDVEEGDKNEYTWLFRKFYTMMSVASQGGIVCIS